MESETQNEQAATQKQKALINSLLDELAYSPEAASDAYASADSKEKAGKLIEELLEEKRVLQEKNLLPGKVNGFDKISFAMIYKLVWADAMEHAKKGFVTKDVFIQRVHSEYKLFKDAADYCKKAVAEGGAQ